jgi:hypothetical protein
MQHLKSLKYGGAIYHLQSGLIVVSRIIYQKISTIQILEWTMRTNNERGPNNPWVTIGNYINGKNIN